jgi:hypothetical protein
VAARSCASCRAASRGEADKGDSVDYFSPIKPPEKVRCPNSVRKEKGKEKVSGTFSRVKKVPDTFFSPNVKSRALEPVDLNGCIAGLWRYALVVQLVLDTWDRAYRDTDGHVDARAEAHYDSMRQGSQRLVAIVGKKTETLAMTFGKADHMSAGGKKYESMTITTVYTVNLPEDITA